MRAMTKSQRQATETADLPDEGAGRVGVDLVSAANLFNAGDAAGARRICLALLERRPGDEGVLLTLAMAEARCGELARAIAVLEELVRVNPKHLGALGFLATFLCEAARPMDAVAVVRHTLALKPDHAPAYATMAQALRLLDRRSEALKCCDAALTLDPSHLLALAIKARVLMETEEFAAAVDAYTQAIALQPNNADFHHELGWCLLSDARYHDSLTASFRALALGLRSAATYNNIGEALHRLGPLHPFDASLAGALMPDGEALPDDRFDPEERRRHGNLLIAELYYARALDRDPGFVRSLTNILFLNEWCDFATPLARRQLAETLVDRSWAPDRSPGRLEPQAATRPDGRIKLGLMSSEFGYHAVAYFLDPLLRQLDRQSFELTLYSTKRRNDDQALAIQETGHAFRDIADLDDAAAARVIADDGVDILIDTSGHTGDDRLGIFAKRPAPIQCHYLGYWGTTGLTTVDYLIADEVLVPPALDACFVEQVWRLPRPWISYRPLKEAPTPRSEIDADRPVVFGSFNNAMKLTPDTLTLWARVLHAVPGSELLVKDQRNIFGDHLDAAVAWLVREGIERERIRLLQGTKAWVDHMAQYDLMDVALDTMPLTSGTTAFDTLWMGVPIVAMPGRYLGGRITATILNGLGRTEWLASDEDGFVEIAVDLARDVEGRRALRASLRREMVDSKLCDTADMARALEAAFRGMVAARAAG